MLLVEGLSQRQAYLKSYPRSKKWKDRTVDNKASALYRRDDIKARYNEILKNVSESLLQDTIASKQEVLEYFTRLMRKEEKEEVVSTVKRKDIFYDEEGRKMEKSTSDPVIIEVSTKNSDSFKGAEALAKHYGVLTSIDTNANELGKVEELLEKIAEGIE